MTAINTDALAKLEEPRKYRKNARAKSETTDPTRQFDTTALHANKHGQHTISHADYIAHCERYDFAFRSITNGDRVLDVGCGVDIPLYHAISKVQAKASAFYAHGGRFLLSTPVYDGKGQARNHLHEYYIDELEALILDVGGLAIERRMGTFANERDVKRWLKEHRPDWLESYVAAREFHTSTFMSGVYAPMLPDLSRNNLWELRRAE